MGVGRFVLLEPNAVKYLLTLEAPTIEDPRSRLRRVTDALVAEGLEVTHAASVLPRLAAADRRRRRLHDHRHGDRRPPGRRGARRHHRPAVRRLDRRRHHHRGRHADGPARRRRRRGRIHDQPAGAVRRRRAHAREPHADARPRGAGTAPRSAIVGTIDGLLGSVCATAGIAREEVLEVVAAGNATMLHLLLGVDPESIGRSPFIATFLEAQDLRAADAGIDDPPRRPARAVPVDRRLRRAPTSWPTSSRPASRARASPGSWSTSARTARSRSGTRSGWSPPRRRRAPRSRAARSCTACAPPKARSRAWSSTSAAGEVRLQVIGGDVEPRGICGSRPDRRRRPAPARRAAERRGHAAVARRGRRSRAIRSPAGCTSTTRACAGSP